MSGGFNHQHGYDSGPLPPGFPGSEPPQYCTVKIFRSPLKPWEAGYSQQSNSYQLSIPRSYNVKQLMDHLGCRNPDPSKNIIIELAERVNGTFSRGYEIRGDNNDRMKKTLAELGYDGSRSAGHNPHVWLWVSDRGFD